MGAWIKNGMGIWQVTFATLATRFDRAMPYRRPTSTREQISCEGVAARRLARVAASSIAMLAPEIPQRKMCFKKEEKDEKEKDEEEKEVENNNTSRSFGDHRIIIRQK